MSPAARRAIEALIADLSPEEALEAIELLASHARHARYARRAREGGATLSGSLAGKLPADADLDRALGEIRSSWGTRILDGMGT